jgi:hypothetical protein
VFWLIVGLGLPIAILVGIAISWSVGGNSADRLIMRPGPNVTPTEDDTSAAGTGGASSVSPAPTASATPDVKDSPTSEPPTVNPSPVVRWATINFKRACATVGGKPIRHDATSISCSVSSTATRPVGSGNEAAVAAAIAQAAATKAGQHECDSGQAVFQDPKTWYCQPTGGVIIPVNWEGICGAKAYRDISTKHPACLVRKTQTVKLTVGSNRLNRYCKDHGYTTSVSGQAPGAPKALNQPYCKGQP